MYGEYETLHKTISDLYDQMVQIKIYYQNTKKELVQSLTDYDEDDGGEESSFKSEHLQEYKSILRLYQDFLLQIMSCIEGIVLKIVRINTHCDMVDQVMENYCMVTY